VAETGGAPTNPLTKPLPNALALIFKTEGGGVVVGGYRKHLRGHRLKSREDPVGNLGAG
jgi:hypothetical protein